MSVLCVCVCVCVCVSVCVCVCVFVCVCVCVYNQTTHAHLPLVRLRHEAFCEPVGRGIGVECITGGREPLPPGARPLAVRASRSAVALEGLQHIAPIGGKLLRQSAPHGLRHIRMSLRPSGSE
jgi:hypothetical protein